MKLLIIKNSILVMVFVVINCILLLTERDFTESTNETLFLLWFVLLLLCCIFINRNGFSSVEKQILRVIYRGITCVIVCVLSWIIVYFLNWYVLYPCIYYLTT